MSFTDKDADLLYELGQLADIKRSFAYCVDNHSVAAHSHRVAMIALMLAKQENIEPYKVILMALAHDIPETRTGDATPFQKPYVQMDSIKAATDILASSVLEDLTEVIEDYEARESIEAKIVKDADIIAAELEMLESTAKGSKYPEYWDKERTEMSSRLYTASARELHALVRKTLPYRRLKNEPNSYLEGKYER